MPPCGVRLGYICTPHEIRTSSYPCPDISPPDNTPDRAPPRKHYWYTIVLVYGVMVRVTDRVTVRVRGRLSPRVAVCQPLYQVLHFLALRFCPSKHAPPSPYLLISPSSLFSPLPLPSPLPVPLPTLPSPLPTLPHPFPALSSSLPLLSYSIPSPPFKYG